MAFRQWVKNCFENVVDPERDTEVTELTKLLHDGINKQKRMFVLKDALAGRSYKPKHLEQATINVYQQLLNRAWADGRIQSSEREILSWVGKCLELPDATLKTLNLEMARPRFAETLAQAMDDGEISSAEAAILDEIAKAGGLPLQQFVQQFFRSEGEQFLRGIFAESVAANHSAVEALEQLISTAEKLGITRDETLRAIQPQAVRYIEHALADAKEDDILTTEEELSLRQLLKSFALPIEIREYVDGELKHLRLLTDIKLGKLPSIKAPQGMNLKAGELIHYYGRAVWQALKILKKGPTAEEHRGSLTITDSRLLFSSETRSESFGFSRIVSHDISDGIIELQVQGKPTQRFYCHGRSRIPAVIFDSALRMASQVLTNQDEGRRSRHISRDVRQRVWQRYSGRCAECDATSYLEFDHIVPVAKGGSNSDANVQLLCRNCNLKKSDMI